MDLNLTSYLVAFILVAAIAAAIASIKVRTTNRRQPGNAAYDERQIIERGRAFRVGFTVTVVAAMACSFAVVVDETLARYAAAMLSGSAMAGGIAVIVLSIWNDAYFSPKTNARSFVVVVVTVFLTATNALVVALHVTREGWATILTSQNSIYVFTTLVFGAALATLLAKRVVEKGEDN